MVSKREQYIIVIGWLIIGIVALTYFRKFTEVERGLLAIGFIGIWRYSVQIIHVIRNARYSRKVFPEIRAKARHLPMDILRFRTYVIVVADYKINKETRQIVWQKMLSSVLNLPFEVKIHIVFSSDIDVESNEFSQAKIEHSNIQFHQLYQNEGKRNALADALDYVNKSLEIDADNTLVALMDGDTGLHDDTLQKVIEIFNSQSHLGAVTTNESVDLECGNVWIQSWYQLKFQKRNHYMKSHALSGRVLTLTGRFSVFHGDIALSAPFITRLRKDVISNWLHGTISFVMGDDKSTCYSVIESGREMLYLPDTYVTTYEHIENSFFPATVSRMLRWYGNMLRNAPRTITTGIKTLPPFIWYCYLDQMISYWTTLIGPIVGVVLLFKYGPAPFLGYLGFVMVTRTLQILVLVWQGHKLTRYDLLLTIYDQWVGSILKIYSTFYPHVQSFALRQKHNYVKISIWRDELSYGLIMFTLVAEIALVISILQW